MTETQRQHQLGTVLVFSAASAWSLTPLFTRLLPYDAWTILFWRGLIGGGLILIFLAMTQGRSAVRHWRGFGWQGCLVAALAALAVIAYIPALQLTSVANVAVIYASVPFVAGAIAWVWLREPARPRTLAASAVALCGVAVIVGGSDLKADLRGLALAFLMTLAFAAMTVIVRRYRDTSMVAAAAISNILSAVISFPFAQSIGGIDAFNLALLTACGLQIALGFTLFVVGSRLLPSAQAALISTVETPLMPFWIWLAFRETPTWPELLGGALVLGAALADIAGDMRSNRRQRLGSQ